MRLAQGAGERGRHTVKTAPVLRLRRKSCKRALFVW